MRSFYWFIPQVASSAGSGADWKQDPGNPTRFLHGCRPHSRCQQQVHRSGYLHVYLVNHKFSTFLSFSEFSGLREFIIYYKEFRNCQMEETHRARREVAAAGWGFSRVPSPLLQATLPALLCWEFLWLHYAGMSHWCMSSICNPSLVLRGKRRGFVGWGEWPDF